MLIFLLQFIKCIYKILMLMFITGSFYTNLQFHTRIERAVEQIDLKYFLNIDNAVKPIIAFPMASNDVLMDEQDVNKEVTFYQIDHTKVLLSPISEFLIDGSGAIDMLNGWQQNWMALMKHFDPYLDEMVVLSAGFYESGADVSYLLSMNDSWLLTNDGAIIVYQKKESLTGNIG